MPTSRKQQLLPPGLKEEREEAVREAATEALMKLPWHRRQHALFVAHPTRAKIWKYGCVPVGVFLAGICMGPGIVVALLVGVRLVPILIVLVVAWYLGKWIRGRNAVSKASEIMRYYLSRGQWLI
jgi:hypothetical protein